MKINDQNIINKEEFNSYFATIDKITGQNVPHSINHYSQYLVNPVTNNIFLESTNQSNVNEIV